jgi:mannose/fructose/N-acetylgalactosamine-specific phosphotransferase system component IIC
MTFADYFLLSIFYFWASSTALSLGIGYYTIYRPVMAGMIAGLILKDAQKGMMAGAVVNIIYIDFVSTGGSFKGDQCLTAILAAMASILFNLHPLEASALAYPFGFLGILIWKYRLKINNVFVYIYEKKYKDKKNPDISVYDGLLPQALLLLMSSLVFVAAAFLMFLLNDIINFKNIGALYYIGLILVIFSAFNVLHKIKNKYNQVFSSGQKSLEVDFEILGNFIWSYHSIKEEDDFRFPEEIIIGTEKYKGDFVKGFPNYGCLYNQKGKTVFRGNFLERFDIKKYNGKRKPNLCTTIDF